VNDGRPLRVPRSETASAVFATARPSPSRCIFSCSSIPPPASRICGSGGSSSACAVVTDDEQALAFLQKNTPLWPVIADVA